MDKSLTEILRKMRDWFRRNRKRTVVLNSFPHRKFTIKGVRPGTTLDRSIEVYGLYEPFLVKKITEVVSHRDRIYDIGAELGYYSKIFSEIIGASYVTAFEPNLDAVRWLKRNVGKQVTIVEKFVGRCEGAINCVSLDQYIGEQEKAPTVLKMDVEGAEASIILESEYIRENRPRLFLEIHPTEIEMSKGGGLNEFFDRLISLYEVRFVRNHWGIVKTKGPLSVVDEEGSYEWFSANHEDLMRISTEIIDEQVQPLCFAVHCFVPLGELRQLARNARV